MATTRELLRSEWHKLLTVPPFNTLGELPNPDHARVAAIFDDDDNIKAYWYIFDAIHVEPLWISEEYRKKPMLAKELLSLVRTMLAEANATVAFGIIKTEDFITHVPMAQRLGFKAVPGNLFYISPDNKALNELINRRKG